MCDVIERSELPGSTPEKPSWRYYVHYHDFNRRMDEWVDPKSGRVVELPSVAGAKHRAVKQEKKKREDEKRREEVRRG